MSFNDAQWDKSSINLDNLNVNCSTQQVHKGNATSNLQDLELDHFECWICLEELGSKALLLEHYNNHMK